MKAPFYFISPDLPNDHICPAKQMLREEEKPRPTASEGKGGKRDEAQDSHQKSEDTSPKVQVGISSGISHTDEERPSPTGKRTQRTESGVCRHRTVISDK